MSKSTSTAIDHEALWRNTVAKLAALSSLRISKLRIKTIARGEIIVGGFGDVRQAKLRSSLFGSDPVVAMKTLRPAGDRKQRIRVIAALARELDVWSKLDHPNILTLDGFHFDESSLMEAWIVTPWQKNGNALKYVEETKADEATRLKLVTDTARGLEYLHTLEPPVCHGDIKAENTLIDNEGNAQLCDFGLATILDAEPSGLTTTNTTSWSLRYAAPELIKGDQALHTLQSDIWAWGCLVFVLMTNTLPYRTQSNERAIENSIRSGQLPADVSSIALPEVIQFVLTGCWRQDALARFDMSLCHAVLQFGTTSLFQILLTIPPSKVPSPFKLDHDGWHVIRNPASQIHYEYESVPSAFNILHFDFTPDSRHIAIVERDWVDQVFLYDAEILSNYHTSIATPGHGVTTLHCSHSGSFLATGHVNGAIRIWESTGWTERYKLTTSRHAIFLVAWANSDATLITASRLDDTISCWNVAQGAVLVEFPCPGVTSLQGSPHHPFIIASGLDVRVLDTERGIGRTLRQVGDPDSILLRVRPSLLAVGIWRRPESLAVFSPDGRALITTGHGLHGLTAWDLRPSLEHLSGSNEQVRPPDAMDSVVSTTISFSGPSTDISSLAITGDGKLIASGSWKQGSLTFWDLGSGQPVMAVYGDKLSEISQIKFRPGSTAEEGTVAYTRKYGSTEGCRVLQFSDSARDACFQ